MPAALQVLVDVAQRRLSAPRISMTAEKFGFNGLLYSSTWIEPVGGTIMLEPPPLNASWHTSNSGNNTRFTLSDFGLTSTAAGWQEADNRGAGPVRLVNGSGMGIYTQQTSSTYGKNRSYFVSFFCYNVENKASAVYFECGLDDDGTGLSGVALRFWSSGQIDIYKDAVQVGGGNIGIQGGADTSNKFADYLIIPMRRRDLLIYSITAGDGFIHTFEDIAEDEPDPVILTDEAFWFRVPGSTNVELAVLKYPTSGYVTSLPISLSVPPPIGATLEPRVNVQPGVSVTNAYIFGDPPYNGDLPDTTNKISAFTVVQTDGSAYTPDGTIRDVLMKATFAGDGEYTPFLYGAHAAYAAEFEDTDDSEEFDITPYIMRNPSPTLSVPDDPGGVEFRFTIWKPETLEASDVALLTTLGNRPVKVKIGSNILLDGVMMEPEFDDAFYDEGARLHCTVKDQLHLASTLQFRERIPLDALLLSDTQHATNYWKSVVQFLAYSGGILNANMDLDNVGFTLPSVPKDGQQEAFSCFIDIGSNPYDELARQVGTYAAGFVWRMKPQGSGAAPKFIFKDPDTLSATPDYTLYRTAAAAVAASKPATDVYWTYSDRPLPIEANEVRVTGYDPRAKQVISAYSIDDASQDPTTSPSSRPTNWTGTPLVFGVIDGRFTSQDACNRVVAAIFPRVSARYYISQFTSEMLFKASGAPVWPSDLVSLDGRRDVRISAMTVEFIVEDGSTFVARNATYTGGAIMNRGGYGTESIVAAQLRAAISKTFVYGGSEFIAAQTPAVTVLVP